VTGDSHCFSREENDTPHTRLASENSFSHRLLPYRRWSTVFAYVNDFESTTITIPTVNSLSSTSNYTVMSISSFRITLQFLASPNAEVDRPTSCSPSLMAWRALYIALSSFILFIYLFSFSLYFTSHVILFHIRLGLFHMFSAPLYLLNVISGSRLLGHRVPHSPFDRLMLLSTQLRLYCFVRIFSHLCTSIKPCTYVPIHQTNFPFHRSE